jgi:hypothetical protein
MSGSNRAYDAPDLTPRQFMEAVMHDRDLPLWMRMKAAEELMKLGPLPHEWPYSRTTDIVIRIPEMPGMVQ